MVKKQIIEHLYIAKTSDLRKELKRELKSSVELLLEEIEHKLTFSDFLLPETRKECIEIIDKHWNEIKNHHIPQRHQTQVIYFIVDHLMIQYLTKTDHLELEEYDENTKLYVLSIMEVFRNYIVLHEFAALSWGDKIVKPRIIFDLLDNTDLSMKHMYHILGEMSITHPVKTVEYTKEKVENKERDPILLSKIRAKMIKDRRRTEKMAKNIVVRLDEDEVTALFDNT